MAKPKTVERGILSGAGASVSEAKADLNGKIDAALHGSYEPTLLTHGAYTAVIYRTPRGWYYALKNLSEIIVPGETSMGCSLYYADRAECFQNAAFHVLDLGSSPDDFHRDSDIPEYLVDGRKRDCLLTNARFRRAYWHARNNGIGTTDREWHRWGCQNERDPRFA